MFINAGYEKRKENNMTTEQIKNLMVQIFYRQIVISCGQKRTIISNGNGTYRYFKTQEIIANKNTGDFYAYKTAQK